MRRHSEKNLSSTKGREYENIVYNDQGLPVILATHRGEKADEKMPFYQQNWLHQGQQPRTARHNYATKTQNVTTPAFTRQTLEQGAYSSKKATNQITDPLMYSLLHSHSFNEPTTKPSLGFYEDKLINRDSGTDSPTYHNYEDQNNILNMIEKLGTEHEKLTQGEPATERRWYSNRGRIQGSSAHQARGQESSLPNTSSDTVRRKRYTPRTSEAGGSSGVRVSVEMSTNTHHLETSME